MRSRLGQVVLRAWWTSILDSGSDQVVRSLLLSAWMQTFRDLKQPDRFMPPPCLAQESQSHELRDPFFSPSLPLKKENLWPLLDPAESWTLAETFLRQCNLTVLTPAQLAHQQAQAQAVAQQQAQSQALANQRARAAAAAAAAAASAAAVSSGSGLWNSAAAAVASSTEVPAAPLLLTRPKLSGTQPQAQAKAHVQPHAQSEQQRPLKLSLKSLKQPADSTASAGTLPTASAVAPTQTDALTAQPPAPKLKLVLPQPVP